MKPIFRYTNVNRLLIDGPSSRLWVACDCVMLMESASRSFLLTAMNLFDGCELDPTTVGTFHLDGPLQLIGAKEIADATSAHVTVGRTRLAMVPRDGTTIRRDRWFSEAIPEEHQVRVELHRNLQLGLNLAERELDGYPANDSFRAHFEEMVRYLADRLQAMEHLLARI